MKKAHKFQSVKNRIQTSQTASQNVDTGRSMLEMLGVLAVIGILSVASILGYRYAMTKYQANQIVYEMNLISNQTAGILMKDHVEEFDLVFGEPYDSNHLVNNNNPFYFGCGDDSEIDEPCQPAETMYYQIVENLPYNLCQSVVQMAENLVYSVDIKVNDVSENATAACSEDMNNRVVVFFDIGDEFAGGELEEGEVSGVQYETSTSYYYETTSVSCEINETCINFYGTYRPVCDRTEYRCIGCATDSDCAPFTSYPACYIYEGDERGNCVTCTKNEHCKSINPALPVCKNQWTCVQCMEDADCATVEGLPVCNVSENKCVQCKTDADCENVADKPYCNTSNNTCGECTTDAQCQSKYGDEFPYCVKKMCKACKSNWVANPNKIDGKWGFKYAQMCKDNEWIDWSGEDGCQFLGSGLHADTYCQNQGGLPSVYDILLISDNPTKWKDGDKVKACYRSNCLWYKGPFPTTDAYKGKWKEVCPARSAGQRVFTNVAKEEGLRVQVVMSSGSMSRTEDGSGNYWLYTICKDYLSRATGVPSDAWRSDFDIEYIK